MAHKRLTPDVADVLRNSTITGNILQLPGQLKPELYRRVDGALNNLGGKWKRNVGHVFSVDPSKALAAALDAGVAIDQKKKKQAFYTPAEIAIRVAQLGLVGGRVVLEPSAGHGALADACIAAGAKAIHCIDSDPEAADVLRSKRLKVLEIGDFLKMTPQRKYDRIVMNPPFTRGADLKHVTHALNWLATGGRLVAVVYGHDTSRFGQFGGGGVRRSQQLPRGAFAESGTDIPTSIIIIDK